MDKILISILGIGLMSFGGNSEEIQEPQVGDLQPIPDKLVVLTFDDACKSHVNFAAPLLKTYGFGATFFVTEGFRSGEDWDKKYLTWADIQKIDDMGFEIGNHTRRHRDVKGLSKEELRQEIEYIEERCREYGILHPTTFWGLLHIPPKRYIKELNDQKYPLLQDDRWHLCCVVFPFVYAAIAAFQPEANRHEFQRVTFLRRSNSVSH